MLRPGWLISRNKLPAVCAACTQRPDRRIEVRFADFQTITRSLTLPEPTNITQELLQAGIELLTTRCQLVTCRCDCWGSASDSSMTRVPFSSTFSIRATGSVFGNRFVADQITPKFGKRAIRRGAGLPYERRVDQRS